MSNDKACDWQSSSEKIGGFRCVEHKLTDEVALICIRGEIWRSNDTGSYRAVVTNHHTANKLSSLLKQNQRYRRGDEALLSFNIPELAAVIKMLGVLTNLQIAKKRANEFCHLASRRPSNSKTESTKESTSFQTKAAAT